MTISHTTRSASFDEVVKEMDRRGHVIELLEAQIAALATPPPQQADAVREAAFNLTPDEQYALATAIAANVGYDLTPEAPHPDAPGPGAFEAAADRALATSGDDTAVVTLEDHRAALTEPAPAGEAVEPVEVVTDIPSAIAVKIMQLDWTRGGTDDEHADRYGQLQDLLLVEFNMAGFAALAEAARLREELERVTRERDVLTALVADQTVKLTAKDAQLDDARRENRTAREDELDTAYAEARLGDTRVARNAAEWLSEIAMLPADRAALRASTAGSPTDGE